MTTETELEDKYVAAAERLVHASKAFRAALDTERIAKEAYDTAKKASKEVGKKYYDARNALDASVGA